MFLYNIFVGIRPHSEATARLRCSTDRDITLVNFQSHMHSRGVGYRARIDDGEPFYTSTSWDDVPVLDFGEGKKIPKGSKIDFSCDYKNNEDHVIFQGPSTADEMCMAIGAFYPADTSTAFCGIDGVERSRDIGGEWVGQGKVSCKDTMGCVQQALAGDDAFHEMMMCVMDSDGEKSKVLADALRCMLLNQGGDPSTACAPELDVCMAN
jgi:hypothetical protein